MKKKETRKEIPMENINTTIFLPDSHKFWLNNQSTHKKFIKFHRFLNNKMLILQHTDHIKEEQERKRGRKKN